MVMGVISDRIIVVGTKRTELSIFTEVKATRVGV